jgi:transcriptional regulator with XRE-family HTH domain
LHKLPASTNHALRQLGATVRSERVRISLSQEDFAERCGVHRNYIGRVERAEINLSFDTLGRIAAGLKLTVAELCRRAGV